MERFSRTRWGVLAFGEVAVNVWLAMLVPGMVRRGLHAVGVRGLVLDLLLVVTIVAGLVALAHMVRLVLDRDERSWAWRQVRWPPHGHPPDAV